MGEFPDSLLIGFSRLTWVHLCSAEALIKINNSCKNVLLWLQRQKVIHFYTEKVSTVTRSSDQEMFAKQPAVRRHGHDSKFPAKIRTPFS